MEQGVAGYKATPQATAHKKGRDRRLLSGSSLWCTAEAVKWWRWALLQLAGEALCR